MRPRVAEPAPGVLVVMDDDPTALDAIHEPPDDHDRALLIPAVLRGMRRSPILMGNDQHRARCDLKQPMGNAAKQKSFQRATSDTAEND
jgi:hypothetical protein